MNRLRSPSFSSHARGFSLVAAIFVLVVLASLGVVIVIVGEVQRATVIAALQGARAFHAAQSGVEWGVRQALPPTSSCAATTLTDAGLNGFSVAVGCTSTSHQEGGTNYNVYTLTATATSGTFGNSDFAQRVVIATVTDAPAP